MRILIFGGDGMLGHQLLESWRGRHEVFVTLRQTAGAYARYAPIFEGRALYGVEVRNLQDVVDAVATARPELVVNAVGIVKQRAASHDVIPSLEVNSLFPHRLASVCRAASAFMVHLSTDCVFSGSRGHYTEADAPDAKDLYGRTKLLGEVIEPHCLTLRTSIIGMELGRSGSLIEWFLEQRGAVRGFRGAIYSGLTTLEVARAIEHLVSESPRISGLWHLASEPINKCDLLTRLAIRLERQDIQVSPDDSFQCDRSLDWQALRAQTSYRVPPWEIMLDELGQQIRSRATD